MAPHKPRKSSSIQDTDDEDMIVYDMAEQIESPKKNDKYFLSEEYWKNESWRQGGFLHVITPTLFGAVWPKLALAPLNHKITHSLTHLGDFRQRKRFDQKAYKLPPPTPAHVPAETHKRPLEQQPKPLSKKKRVIITPIIRPSVPSVRIIKPSTALSTPQPVSIPDPSPEQTTSQILLPDPPVVETTSQIHLPDPLEQTTSQILLPDPPSNQTTSQILLPDPPVVETTSEIHLPDPPSNQTTSQIYLPDPNVVEALEPTLTDDSSIDQIMSSVFGDYLPQGIPSAHIQDPQVLDTVPSLFDENNDLISFLDYFEAGLAMEQQETPMDLTMPRMKKVINTTGFKVIKPLDLSIRNCLPCM
ncbi:uncharacterized protein TNCV_2595461 [Trichonephila clavipes]|nr:uncharacterized protein TNCV_2595461 [Trichonephila clavipes]